MEQIFKIVVPLPKYKHVEKATKDRTTKSGTFKPATQRKEFIRLALTNNIQYWYRFQKTKVKNNYKTMLKEFFLPEPTELYKSLTVEYRILRHNKRKIDSDAIAFGVKWITDSLCEIGYVKDDDTVTHVLIPAEYREGLVETQLELTVLA